MLFRKKIREEPKKRPFGNYRGGQIESSSWSHMSIIEKFVMLVLPSMMVFIFYTILEQFEWIWWFRLIVSIGIEVLIMILIYSIVWFFVGRDY